MDELFEIVLVIVIILVLLMVPLGIVALFSWIFEERNEEDG